MAAAVVVAVVVLVTAALTSVATTTTTNTINTITILSLGIVEKGPNNNTIWPIRIYLYNEKKEKNRIQSALVSSLKNAESNTTKNVNKPKENVLCLSY